MRTSTAFSAALTSRAAPAPPGGGLSARAGLESPGPDLAGAGPLHELELAHQSRLDEVGIPRRLDAEGRVGALERLQQPLQPGQRGVGEAGAHTTRVHEAVPLPVTDEEGSGKASPLTLPLHPAADD